MQYQQTFGGLQDMYNMPVAMMPQAMSLANQQQDADALTSQDNQRQFAYDQANDPLKLQRSGLDNQLLQAQIPGQQALSNMHVRKDQNEASTNDAYIKDVLGKYKADDVKRQVSDLENLGQIALSHSETSMMEPFGAAARVKQAFVDAGHGDLWQPEWDNLPVGQLALKLRDFGTRVQQHTAAYSRALDQADMKAASAANVANINADARVQAAQTAAEARRAAIRPQSKENMSQYEARIREAAASGDPDAATALAILERQKVERAQAGPTVNANTKPDLNALGIPTVGATGGAKVPPPISATSGPGPGWTDNGDGTWTNGTVTIRKKQ